MRLNEVSTAAIVDERTPGSHFQYDLPRASHATPIENLLVPCQTRQCPDILHPGQKEVAQSHGLRQPFARLFNGPQPEPHIAVKRDPRAGITGEPHCFERGVARLRRNRH